jgi:hypothetical protein
MGQLLNTRFKLTTALGNSGHCSRANTLIDEALELIEDRLPELAKEIQKAEAIAKPEDKFLQLELKNFRESDSQLRRNKAYLLVVKSRCSTDLQSMAQYAAAAVQASPNLVSVLLVHVHVKSNDIVFCKLNYNISLLNIWHNYHTPTLRNNSHSLTTMHKEWQEL